MSTKPHVLVLILLGLRIWAQDLPSWVHFQRGRLAWSQGHWTEAIKSFREALTRRSVYPEADWYLGKVYSTLGELSSARQHLEAALADADFLRFPQDRYRILYDLDDLWALDGGRSAVFQRINILREQVLLTKRDEQRPVDGELRSIGDQDRQRFLNSFLEPYVGRVEERRQGLDRVLFLYRRDPDYTLGALTRLARIWTDHGAALGADPRLASGYALHALLMLFSRTLRELQQTDPDFQFGVLTPTLYPAQRGSPATERFASSLFALFQPARANSGPRQRLRMHEPAYRYLLENQAPVLLQVLARNLRRWSEAVDVALQREEAWEGRLERVLGDSPGRASPWKEILQNTDETPITYAQAAQIGRHLQLREREVCQVLADLFTETPEGLWASQRLRETQGRDGGLVRPVLSR